MTNYDLEREMRHGWTVQISPVPWGLDPKNNIAILSLWLILMKNIKY